MKNNEELMDSLSEMIDWLNILPNSPEVEKQKANLEKLIELVNQLIDIPRLWTEKK